MSVLENMIRIGLIGLGRMGRLHMMNCLQVDDVKIVAAADPSKKALKRAESLGVGKLYVDYHEMLNDSHNEIDAVVISLPNFEHFESIKLALEAGLNVFTEKPMANSVDQCNRIVKLVQKSGRKLMVGHNWRFLDAVAKMKEVTDKGHIGDIEVVTIEEVINGPFAHPVVPTPVSDWWFDPKKAGGGALFDIGYHLIDLYRYFAGDANVLFSCLDHKFSLPIEDGAIVILGSSNSSAKGIINVGWYMRTIFPRFNFRLILHGNAGYMSSEELVPQNLYLYSIKQATKNVLRRVVSKKIQPLAYTYFYETYYKELRHFLDSVKHDFEPAVSATDGLRTVEIIEEAYKIVKTNTRLVAGDSNE